MLTGRRKDGPDDQIVFCSGFAFRQLNTSMNPETRRFFSLTRFSTRTSRSVMWSIRLLPTGSASTVTVPKRSCLESVVKVRPNGCPD